MLLASPRPSTRGVEARRHHRALPLARQIDGSALGRTRARITTGRALSAERSVESGTLRAPGIGAAAASAGTGTGGDLVESCARFAARPSVDGLDAIESVQSREQT